MDEAKCIFNFNPTTTGFYGVYLTVEDFAPSNTTVPLSSVPLQLLVQVTDRPEDCCKSISNFLNVTRQELSLSFSFLSSTYPPFVDTIFLFKLANSLVVFTIFTIPKAGNL